MRGEVLRFEKGFTVVDDSYNSNPRSLVSMAHTVAEASDDVKRRIIVAGEMLELGPQAAEMHREAGREIAQLNIDVLWGVRGLAREMVEGAREAGLTRSLFFESSDDVAEILPGEIRTGDLILVKGSRSVETDKVVSSVRERFALVDQNRKQ